MSELAFDRISVKKWLGSKLMSAEDFLAMPKEQRIQLITSGKVTFLKDGQPVDLMTAVKSIADSGR